MFWQMASFRCLAVSLQLTFVKYWKIFFHVGYIYLLISWVLDMIPLVLLSEGDTSPTTQPPTLLCEKVCTLVNFPFTKWHQKSEVLNDHATLMYDNHKHNACFAADFCASMERHQRKHCPAGLMPIECRQRNWLWEASLKLFWSSKQITKMAKLVSLIKSMIVVASTLK